MPTRSKYRMVNGERVKMSDTEHQEETNELDAAVEKQKRESLREKFISEGVSRISTHVPELDTLEEVRLVKAIWPSISVSVGDPLDECRKIYVYVTRDVLPNIDAIPAGDLDVVDPAADDPFINTSFDGTADDPGGWPA